MNYRNQLACKNNRDRSQAGFKDQLGPLQATKLIVVWRQAPTDKDCSDTLNRCLSDIRGEWAQL